ncbi:hypothetical protein [Pyrodictium abyssi]|uniref:Uncharacterized protein n=1 Tax=Pyrodictium abyssi TaxID=54256 RepID=A0ABM8IW12_9CREN|nr:hypothetical protein PABY_12990 [Pyrodictium abyssi]
MSVEKQLLEEIRGLQATLKRIEALLEERLLGVDEPLPDEAEATREYELDRKRIRLELVSLDQTTMRLLGDGSRCMR